LYKSYPGKKERGNIGDLSMQTPEGARGGREERLNNPPSYRRKKEGDGEGVGVIRGKGKKGERRVGPFFFTSNVEEAGGKGNKVYKG